MNPSNPYLGLPPSPGDLFQNGGPVQPDNAVTKLRKRIGLAKLMIVVAIVIGACSYGGYALLSTKQTPKKHSVTTVTANSKPIRPPGSVSKPVSKPKAAKKPASHATASSNSSAASTATKPAASHAAAVVHTISCKGYSNGYCYQWVGGRQFISASGVSVKFAQAAPKTTGTALNGHTLVELSVGTSDGRQYVEVGWILPAANGDKRPRLFVYHWVNGHTSCYNGCGFVQVSSSIHPGDALTVGATGTYKINYSGGQWQVFYNGTEVGYFPESLWSGTFTQAGFTQIFGEVASSTLPTCTQMGDGIYGSASGSLLISGYSLIGSGNSPSLSPYNLNNFNGSRNSGYNYGAVTPTSMRIGGPGC